MIRRCVSVLLLVLVAGCGDSSVVGTPMDTGATPSDSGSGCTPGTSLCAAACVDTVTNPEHCGTCDNACRLDQGCAASICVVCGNLDQACCRGATCGPDLSCVAGLCVTSCGTGGRPCCPGDTCAMGFMCSAGACIPSMCPATETMCGDMIDDDCDGTTDCADSDCTGQSCGTMGETCDPGGSCALSGSGDRGHVFRRSG